MERREWNGNEYKTRIITGRYILSRRRSEDLTKGKRRKGGSDRERAFPGFAKNKTPRNAAIVVGLGTISVVWLVRIVSRTGKRWERECTGFLEVQEGTWGE